jgi:S-adenosylmethionine-diacylgycerolhomoserine-N-methlytransferase
MSAYAFMLSAAALVSTHLNSNDAALKNYYRWHAPIYDATRWAFLFGRARLIETAFEIAKPQPKRILELGCGTGKNLLHLARRFPHAEIIGCDLSEAMLARAQANVKRKLSAAEQARVSLSNADVTATPLQFDLIVCSYVMSMTGDQMAPLLARLHRCLTPTGRFAIVDFDQTRWSWFARWMRRNHVRMDGSLARTLAQLGRAEIVQTHTGFGLWRWLLWVGR